MIRRIKKLPRHQLNVRKGDEVLVIAGNDKGKRGKVLKVFPREDRIIIEGVNFIKRHTKPSPKVQQGGIIEREGKIHVSNVQVICPKTGKPTRVGTSFIDEGGKTRRARVAKVSGEVLD